MKRPLALEEPTSSYKAIKLEASSGNSSDSDLFFMPEMIALIFDCIDFSTLKCEEYVQLKYINTKTRALAPTYCKELCFSDEDSTYCMTGIDMEFAESVTIHSKCMGLLLKTGLVYGKLKSLKILTIIIGVGKLKYTTGGQCWVDEFFKLYGVTNKEVTIYLRVGRSVSIKYPDLNDFSLFVKCSAYILLDPNAVLRIERCYNGVVIMQGTMAYQNLK
jgi:hypothetical protein